MTGLSDVDLVKWIEKWNRLALLVPNRIQELCKPDKLEFDVDFTRHRILYYECKKLILCVDFKMLYWGESESEQEGLRMAVEVAAREAFTEIVKMQAKKAKANGRRL